MKTSKLDDALIHQNYGTIANVVDDDVRWFDRYYMNLQRSEEHTSELQSLVKISYAVFCL